MSVTACAIPGFVMGCPGSPISPRMGTPAASRASKNPQGRSTLGAMAPRTAQIPTASAPGARVVGPVRLVSAPCYPPVGTTCQSAQSTMPLSAPRIVTSHGVPSRPRATTSPAPCADDFVQRPRATTSHVPQRPVDDMSFLSAHTGVAASAVRATTSGAVPQWRPRTATEPSYTVKVTTKMRPSAKTVSLSEGGTIPLTCHPPMTPTLASCMDENICGASSATPAYGGSILTGAAEDSPMRSRLQAPFAGVKVATRAPVSPCKTRQGCSISTTAAGHMDEQIRGASVVTTAYGGSMLTRAADGSPIRHPPFAGISVSARAPVTPRKARQGCSISTTAAGHMDEQIRGAGVVTAAYGGSMLTRTVEGSPIRHPPFAGVSVSSRAPVTPRKARQGCSISTTAAGHMDEQIRGASVVTTAYGGSVLTSVAGGSVITTPVSHLDSPSAGGSMLTSAAGGSIITNDVPQSYSPSSAPSSSGSAATAATGGISKKNNREAKTGPASSEVQNLQAVDEAESDNMTCIVVAFKDNGLPLIWRLENKNTGKLQTIVEHEDGSVKAFGDSTMSSIENSEEAKTLKYADALSDIDLRGFVHEVEQRVTDRFRIFNKKQRELEELCDTLDREYFGIGKDATKSDLDKAYRKLAKKMHPDKNGGTEAAKQAFQNMFDRYKRLRSKCRESPNELDLAERYVNRVLLRACAKEDEGVKRFVDRVSARAFKRASKREAGKEINLELVAAQTLPATSPTEQPKDQPEKTQGEDYQSRGFLWKQVTSLIRNYKMVRQNLVKIDADLERLRACRKST